MSQQQSIPDWQIDHKKKSAQHKTGLIIQLNKSASSRRPAALEILSLEKLVGTPWANRSNALIEAGISLLKAL